MSDALSPWSFEPRRVDKPWGYELIWAVAEVYVGKILFREKDESWFVQSGRATLELGAEGAGAMVESEIGAGEAFRYRPGTVHRVTAIDDTTILEVSTPQLEDIVRLADAYGRS